MSRLFEEQKFRDFTKVDIVISYENIFSQEKEILDYVKTDCERFFGAGKVFIG